jgi:hypothetical protein
MTELLYKPDPKRLARRSAGYVPNELVEGVRVDWGVDEYHTAHAAGTVSRSELGLFAENPAKYRGEVMQGRKREVKDGMRLGQCLHMEVLQGHERAPVVPTSVLSSDGKNGWRRYGDKWKRWLAENGQYYLLPKETEPLQRMVDAIRGHEQVAEFLDVPGRFGTRHESTILAQHAPTGLKTRCRYDIESVWLFDIKKTMDVSPESFASHCLDFGYHCQGAFYQDHLQALLGEPEPRPFILIAVQDSEPFECVAYEMAPEFIEIGRTLNAHRLDLFAMFSRAWEAHERIAMENGKRPDPSLVWEPVAKGKIQFLKPPVKAIYQMEWETDLETAAKAVEERLRKAAAGLGVSWEKLLGGFNG